MKADGALSSAEPAAAEGQLVRALRRRDIIGFLLNVMLGAGMLTAPAKVYGLVDGWGLLVLLASALAVLPVILCFAELGSRFSGTGGPYLYARAALPPWIAFASGWMLWVAQALGAATLSNLFVSYLAGYVPALGEGAGRILALGAVGLVCTGIVLVGIRQAAGASNLVIAVKLAFIALFLAAVLPFAQMDRLAPAAPPPAATPFIQAMLIFIFGYSGFERAALVAGEARDPRRDVPASLLFALALVTAVFALAFVACVGVLADPAANDRPFAEAGRTLYGPLGAAVVSAGALAVTLGTLLVIVVSMPRNLLALAEHGEVPALLARIHPRWRTPHVAIVVSSLVGFGAGMVSDLLSALTMSTAARLVVYILACVALIRLVGRAQAPPAAFRLPFARVAAVAAILSMAAVVAFGATKELPALAGVLAAGFVVMLATRAARRRTIPKGS
ncbi:MAG: APC family permease [Phenylobacterium sp.]|uniref:APC family permease n=1 Tax=Phenylobacterium sp. TaxID=1871053 RepID=UPI001A62BBC5|nr:APC family permease [Phenylobacterium sp.]MBL8770206.1 APC family permease [Phenylobacterium sp.]